MFGGIKNRRQSNLDILSQTLKLIRSEEKLSRATPTPTHPPELPHGSSVRPSVAKREVGIEGNGIIQKKKPEFINFKALLTS